MQFIIRWVSPLFLLLVGVYFQIPEENKDLLILPRMGALIVVLGILIESRYVLRIIGDNVYTGAGTLIVGKTPTPTSFKEYMSQFIHHIGLVWIIFGTLIWAFGDLL